MASEEDGVPILEEEEWELIQHEEEVAIFVALQDVPLLYPLGFVGFEQVEVVWGAFDSSEGWSFNLTEFVVARRGRLLGGAPVRLASPTSGDVVHGEVDFLRLMRTPWRCSPAS